MSAVDRPWWKPWMRAPDETEEACRVIAHLQDQDAAVRELGGRLREAQVRNHFSEMVEQAILHATPTVRARAREQ